MEKEAFPMNGGDGPNSYAKNSSYQEEGLNSVKDLLTRSIQENVEIQDNSKAFTVADLGCSIGPNTFRWVQAVIDAVELKRSTKSLPELEFQVFFNDHVTNDFNSLFKNLPLDRNYMVAAVPGSFYNQLFPKQSMSFMNSSFAVQWLTKLPDEVTTKGSPAWNKGRITYSLSSKEVINAFSAQFSDDLETFISARALELAPGGLLSILTLCTEDGDDHSDNIQIVIFEAIGAALMDMVKKGLIKEELLDSFNFPLYFPKPSEVKQVVAKCKGLTIEMAEVVYLDYDIPKDFRNSARGVRAVTEDILSKHFGYEIMDELFERYVEKMEEVNKTFTPARSKKPNLFIVIKRSF